MANHNVMSPTLQQPCRAAGSAYFAGRALRRDGNWPGSHGRHMVQSRFPCSEDEGGISGGRNCEGAHSEMSRGGHHSICHVAIPASLLAPNCPGFLKQPVLIKKGVQLPPNPHGHCDLGGQLLPQACDDALISRMALGIFKRSPPARVGPRAGP